VVASCNIDKGHLKKSLDAINGHYKNKDCKPYHDYREMMARKDIDAVMIAVPDHWHELIAVEAAKQGKDIYGEKPLAKTIVEQQSHRQSGAGKRAHLANRFLAAFQRHNFHKAAEIVRNGMIGKITRVEVGLPAGHTDFGKDEGQDQSDQAAARIGLQHVDRPLQNGPLHQMRKPFELALELQHRRRPVDGLGRAIMWTSRIGGWVLTTTALTKWRATAIFRPRTRFGTLAPSTALNANIPTTST
jgi:hypothetical protein